VEISHAGAKQSRRGVTVRRVVLERADVSSTGGIPVTSPARTLADLARILPPARFDAAFHHCLHTEIVTPQELREMCRRRGGPGHPRTGRLRDAVDAYSGRPAGSPLEARFARRLRGTKLPAPVRQHEVHAGGRVCRLDFAWPDRHVAVEVDGYRWHSSRASWRRDRERLSALRRAGWKVLNVEREDVDERFDDLAAELRTLLH
jgi:very-short-patch-repair endonuclease